MYFPRGSWSQIAFIFARVLLLLALSININSKLNGGASVTPNNLFSSRLINVILLIPDRNNYRDKLCRFLARYRWHWIHAKNIDVTHFRYLPYHAVLQRSLFRWLSTHRRSLDERWLTYMSIYTSHQAYFCLLRSRKTIPPINRVLQSSL